MPLKLLQFLCMTTLVFGHFLQHIFLFIMLLPIGTSSEIAIMGRSFLLVFNLFF